MFFKSYFCTKKISWYINVKKWENKIKEGQESFFSYDVVKDGEFMKLSFACEDIVSTVLLAIEGGHH